MKQPVTAMRQAGSAIQQEEPLLSVSNLSVLQALGDGRRRVLVDKITLAVRRQEVIGIVGESGSGKSLTAAALLNLLPRNIEASGSARFEGSEILGISERDMRRIRGGGIALLLQDPSTMLNPLRRCVTHVEEGLAMAARRGSRRVRRSEALRRLAEVGIGEQAALRYPFEVSGGMAQRVALAAALARDPRLLIADEPTTALDVTTQAELFALLAKLCERREMGLVLITHDLRVAFEVCDRVYALYAGSIVETGAAGEVSHAPFHPYTRGLLLSEPSLHVRQARMDIIPGSVAHAYDVLDVCPFEARCQWKTVSCLSGHPNLVERDQGHSSACVRFPEIRNELALKREGSTPQLLEASQIQEAEEEGYLLLVDGLTKEYGASRADRNTALSEVSLGVAMGQSVGVVGESGSGKTTLARCILGLETSSGGSLRLGDIDISDYRNLTGGKRAQVRGMVQMVFQNPYASLNPALSVGSTLGEALRVAERHGIGSTGTVTGLLDQVSLPANYASRRPGSLSGGERQRIAIARALAAQPRLLVCDEPTSALDVSVQAQVLNLLRDIQRDLGLAMLFITHDLAVVRQISEYLYVLREGRVVEQGATPTVLDHPADPYTQRLLESVSNGAM